MASFKKEWLAEVKAPTPWILWAVLSIVVAYAGPFGTYDGFPFATRAIYWVGVIGLSIFVGISTRVAVRVMLPRQNYWVVSAVSAVAISLVLVCPLRLFSLQLSGGDRQDFPSLLEFWAMIFLVSLSVSAVRSLLHVARGEPTAPARPRLLDRIEPALRGQILRCSAVDHFVDVYTANGTERLRMRFSDALAELDPNEGLQVHRSHWVAQTAVNGHLVDKGRLFLRLQDGSLIPVSRKLRPIVEERGLI